MKMVQLSCSAGDNLIAKQKTLALISRLGFQGVDIGALTEAKHLENLALFWIHMSHNTSVAMAPIILRPSKRQGLLQVPNSTLKLHQLVIDKSFLFA